MAKSRNRTTDEIRAGLEAKARAKAGYIRFDERAPYRLEFVEMILRAASEPGIPVPDLSKEQLSQWLMKRFAEHQAKSRDQ